jgi:hypothetical protein
MAARRSWSKTTSNVNTFCPVSSTSTECAAGYTAPPLTATTLANACPSYTVNLNSLHTATVPIGSSLVWYDNAAHFGLAISNPAAVAANATYYAFYYDPSINCYSPASTGVVVTITNCCAINGSNFISVNSPTSVNGVTVSRSITGNAVSEISGGGGNNTCGVNRTGTSYAAYLVTQQGGPSTTGSVTFTFDKPVNNVVVRSLAMHAGNSPAESMTITTNNGTVTTSSIYECSVTKSGNTYTSTYPSSSSPGGDVVTTVTSTLPYTTLTVTGVSNLSNGGFYIDICGSSIQAATATPSCAAGTAAPVINSN